MRVDRRAFKPSRSKGAWPASRDLLLLILGPPPYFHISMFLADWSPGLQTKNAKVGQKCPGMRHVTYFYNCGSPSISLERLTLETSNFTCRLITRHTKRKMQKYFKGAWPTSRDLLL